MKMNILRGFSVSADYQPVQWLDITLGLLAYVSVCLASSVLVRRPIRVSASAAVS